MNEHCHLLFCLCASLRKEFQGWESPDSKPTSKRPVSIGINLCYEYVVNVVEGLAYFFVSRSQSFAVATP